MFKPQIRIPATYMRGGSFFDPVQRFQPLILVAAKKCDFFLLAGTSAWR